LVQIKTIPFEGVGQDAVQTVPVWTVGWRIVPSLVKHIADAIASSDEHSDVQPTELQAVLPMIFA
jgi:hypothetical protein